MRARNNALLLLLVLIPAQPVLAKTGGTYPLVLSLWSPAEIPVDPEISVKGAHLGLFYAKAVRTAGFAWMYFGAYRSVEEFKGANLAMINLFHRMYGYQSGLINSGERFRGVQAGGLVNIYRESSYGLTGAPINVGKDYRGVQGGLINKNKGYFYGWQSGVLVNRTLGPMRGVQSSVFGINIAHDLIGIQSGSVNYAAKMSGLQSGILNIAGDLKGVQFGLINISRPGRTIPIGLINLIWGGALDLKYAYSQGNTWGYHEIQLRTRGPVFYGSYSFILADHRQYIQAMYDYPESAGITPQIGLGWGIQPFFGRWFVDAELKLHAIPLVLPVIFFDPQSLDYSLKVTPGCSFFNRRFGISIGPQMTRVSAESTDYLRYFRDTLSIRGWQPALCLSVWMTLNHKTAKSTGSQQ